MAHPLPLIIGSTYDVFYSMVTLTLYTSAFFSLNYLEKKLNLDSEQWYKRLSFLVSHYSRKEIQRKSCQQNVLSQKTMGPCLYTLKYILY